MYQWTYETPLGQVTVAGDEGGLAGLWFHGQQHFAAAMPKNTPMGELAVFRETKRWLEVYFSGKEPDFTPLLSLSGTPFQMLVWSHLLRIPYGQTVSYSQLAGDVASALGRSAMSAQAIGGAVGRNPVSVIVPCHRVVAADGSLHGYAGGLERKAALLALEQGRRQKSENSPLTNGETGI